MGTRHELRTAKIVLAVCLALSGLAVGGCSAASVGGAVASPTASGAGISPSASPVSTGTPSPVSTVPNFGPFPIPTTWAGAGSTEYTMIVKNVTGTTPREFLLVAEPSLVFWLGCIGTGTARVVSPPLKLNWGVPCGTATGADPAGITYIPPRAAVGTPVDVEVTSPPGSRWEFRVDAPESAL